MARIDRVAEAIRQEVSIILHEKLKDPRVGFVTITRVDLSPDMRNAKVFFSVLGNDDDYNKTQKALDSALGYIRSLVAQRINMRFAPEIVFRPDRSTEYSVRIEEVLNEIKGSSPLKAEPIAKPKPEPKVEPKKSRRRNKKT